MTAKEIIEGNKLIAEFLGMEETNIPGFFNTTGEEFLSRITVSCVPFDEVKFHSSWDWLMPVIEKIESQDCHFSFGYIWNWYLSEIIGVGKNTECSMYVEAKSKIESAWLLCVKYINWYNGAKNIL